MAGTRGRVHDRAILDALEAAPSQAFQGQTWRATRKGRDVLRGSGAAGRWNPPGEFEVLYTSLHRDGAVAEIGYRLSLEPVWPTMLQHDVHSIDVETQRTLRFADLASLSPLGVDIVRYETFDYSATQAIGAAAYFLEFDGLVVPSARFPCLNLVLFLERLPAGGHLEVRATDSIDWNAWRRSRSSRGRGEKV